MLMGILHVRARIASQVVNLLVCFVRGTGMHQHQVVWMRLFASFLIAVVFSLPCWAQSNQYVEVLDLRELDFGTATSDVGDVIVDKGYAYIGKFKVRGKVALPSGTYPEVNLTFIPTPFLDGSYDQIPYEMAASTNSQADDPLASNVVSGRHAQITLQNYEGTEDGIDVYSAYVYVFGSISVLNHPSDDYFGSVRLEAELIPRLPPECLADAWNRRTRYYEDDVVTHNGAAWRADRFTIGNEPDRAFDGDEDAPPSEATGEGEPGEGRPWDFVAQCD